MVLEVLQKLRNMLGPRTCFHNPFTAAAQFPFLLPPLLIFDEIRLLKMPLGVLVCIRF